MVMSRTYLMMDSLKTFTCHAEYIDLIKGAMQILPSQDGAICHNEYKESSIIDNSFVCCGKKCTKAKNCNNYQEKIDEFVRDDSRSDL